MADGDSRICRPSAKMILPSSVTVGGGRASARIDDVRSAGERCAVDAVSKTPTILGVSRSIVV